MVGSITLDGVRLSALLQNLEKREKKKRREEKAINHHKKRQKIVIVKKNENENKNTLTFCGGERSSNWASCWAYVYQIYPIELPEKNNKIK